MKDLTQCIVTPKIKTAGFETLGVGVFRGSTIVFKDADAYARRAESGHDGYAYGLYGTPTTRTLEAKLTALEQGVRTFLLPSGQAANTIAMLPFLQSGDKVLIPDTVYPPIRDFANSELARFGIEVSYYDAVDPDTGSTRARRSSGASLPVRRRWKSRICRALRKLHIDTVRWSVVTTPERPRSIASH